jgi:hypothetical protein
MCSGVCACRRGVWSYSFSSHENAFGQGEIVKLPVVKLFWLDDAGEDALNFSNVKTMKLKTQLLFTAILIAFGWQVEAQTKQIAVRVNYTGDITPFRKLLKRMKISHRADRVGRPQKLRPIRAKG